MLLSIGAALFVCSVVWSLAAGPGDGANGLLVVACMFNIAGAAMRLGEVRRRR